MDHEHARRGGDEADWRKVLVDFISEVGIERAARYERSGRDHERVTVGLRFGDDFVADGRSCPGPVLDHHLLAPFARELLAEDARERVRRAAGRPRYDHAYHFGR